ncbi:MAG: integration host factor subunit beta [Bacteroidales bacterium]|nr:integration host factor subunit beta [Bacteroidales bacterium]
MTKAELAKTVSEETGIEAALVKDLIDATMDAIIKGMAEGNNIYLRGFGTFELKHRASKKARNITANTTVTIPECDIPHFKPCDSFKEMLKK